MPPLGKYAECRFAGCQSDKGEVRKYRGPGEDMMHVPICAEDFTRIAEALERGYPVNRTQGGDLWIDNIKDILEGK